MSTRATYQFRDSRGDDFTVYKHSDGYPQGAANWLANAIPLAWELPRFEASDFAAAFIAGNKTEGGGVRMTTGRTAHPDTEWHYVLIGEGSTLNVGELRVEVQKRQGYGRWPTLDKRTLWDFIHNYDPSLIWATPDAVEAYKTATAVTTTTEGPKT